MAPLLKLALASSAIIGLVSSLLVDAVGRQAWVPGIQNNTQEFYLSMVVTDGLRTYAGWTSKWPLPPNENRTNYCQSRRITPAQAWQVGAYF